MLQIGRFISVATQLSLHACEIIKEASQNKTLGKYQKGFDDPVTQADYHVQTMIINGFKKFFPQLKVIGQQTIDYEGQVKINYDSFSQDFLPQNAQFKNLFVPYNEICVWIDPIDCTKGFISGQMYYVTNLIGMSRNKKAYLGVVGAPYKKEKENIQYSPYVTIGVSQTNEAFQYKTTGNQWQRIKPQPLHNPLIITNTKGRVCQNFIQLQSFIQAQSVFAEGSGRKIMMIINGQADIQAYLLSNNSKWDTCAGQAIIKALGGYLTTLKGDEIQYDPHAENYRNPSGQICSLNKELFQKVLQFLNQKNQK